MGIDNNIKFPRKIEGDDREYSREEPPKTPPKARQDFGRVYEDRERHKADKKPPEPPKKKPIGLPKETRHSKESDDKKTGKKEKHEPGIEETYEELEGIEGGEIIEEKAEDLPPTPLLKEGKGLGKLPPSPPTPEKQSPLSMYEQMAAQKGRPVHDKGSSETSKETKGTSSDKVTTRFSQEQPDLAYVNPVVAPFTGGGIQTEVEGAAASRAPDVQVVIERMIKELSMLEYRGETKVTITLDNPPIFKDMKLEISSFDAANKHLEITFSNLSLAGKQLLDNNMNSLKTSLEAQGYVPPDIIKVQVGENVPQDSGQQDRGDERRGGGGRGGEEGNQQQRKRK